MPQTGSLNIIAFYSSHATSYFLSFMIIGDRLKKWGLSVFGCGKIKKVATFRLSRAGFELLFWFGV